jgi:hypothetical protein
MATKKQKSTDLALTNWVVKSNVLNEVRGNHMSQTQMRLFTMYLSKINPKDINTRNVTFKLSEYIKIMQIKRVDTTRLEKTARDLLGLTVKYYDETGEYTDSGLHDFVICQIFNRFRLHKSTDGEWLININCHDDVIHLMFDLQKYYFKFRLWNVLRLTSTNQQKIYEILKQFEYKGELIISVTELREWIGLDPKEYPRWERFRVRILDASQEALKNFTDIKFTWEIHGKRGQGGKVNALKFKIEKNDPTEGVLIDDCFIEQLRPTYEGEPESFECQTKDDMHPRYRARIDLLSDACKDEFNTEEIELLYGLIRDRVSDFFRDDIALHDYLARRYQYLNVASKKVKILNRFSYLKSLIGEEI